MIKKIKGTRDIFEFKNYIALQNELRLYLLLHNFKEINTPSFELESLFSKNLGLSTDIVNKEMYFISHKHSTNEKKSIKMVLRPELTAPIMRSYIENNINESPAKFFQIGSVFRHENPQKGRYREFFQCSIEMINATSIGYDIELLSLLYNFFYKILPTNFQLEINFLGTLEERNTYKETLYKYCIDNIYKFPNEIRNLLSLDSIFRILDTKNHEVENILKEAPTIFEYFKKDSLRKWNTIIKILNQLNIQYIHKTNLVRGLDYYNNLIFEFTSNKLGSQNAFCGGGRYDDLSKNFNNKQIPSLGAGIGLDRVILLMESLETTKEQPLIPIIFNTDINNKAIEIALNISIILQKKDIKSDIYFDKLSMKSALKKANSNTANIVIIINEESLLNNTCIIKNMEKEYCQETTQINNIINLIQNL